MEVAGHEHRNRGERLVIGARAQVRGERHLADVVVQRPAHPPHRRDDLLDRHVLERQPAGRHLGVLERLGQAVGAERDLQWLHRMIPDQPKNNTRSARRGNAVRSRAGTLAPAGKFCY
jgi:hypothetical protein